VIGSIRLEMVLKDLLDSTFHVRLLFGLMV
jgi:hypothetical protein